MPRNKKPESQELVHLKEDRSVEKYDGTLDGMALTIKAPEETSAGVRRRLIHLLRADSTMEKFVEVADMLTKRKGANPPSLDVIAFRAGLEQSDVVGAIAKALHRFSYDYSRIIAAAQMPRVMTTLANEAAHPEGHSDRVLFLRATGHLPTGGGVHVNTQTTVLARAEAAVAVTEGAPSGLPSFEQEMKANITALRTIDVQPA